MNGWPASLAAAVFLLIGTGQAREPRVLEGHKSSVMGVVFSPDGKTLASCSRDRTVRFWEVRTGKLLRSIEGHGLDVYAAVFSPDGRALATCSGDKTLRLWDAASGEPMKTIEGHEDFVRAVLFSPDGKTLASAGKDLTVRLWESETGKPLRTMKGHRGIVKSIAFTPDGRLLASAGGGEGSVRLWDSATGEAAGILEGKASGFETIAISPDGKTLAASSSDGPVLVWDVATRKLIETLTGHEAEADSVAFSPDGKMLASGSKDKTVRLWETQTWRLLKSWTGSHGRIESLAFSPDGATLASGGGGGDTAVKLWDIRPAPAANENREDFTLDPGWEGRNNAAMGVKGKTTRQNFGWRANDHAGVGGRCSRSITPAWYAKVLGKPLTLDDRISASGTFAFLQDDGGSGALFGFFNKDSRGWRTPQSLAFRLDGNGGKAWVFFEYGTRGWLTGGLGCFEGEQYQKTPTRPMPADGRPHAWALEYDPRGAGEITFTLDGTPYTLALAAGHKADGALFDRFGLFNQQTSGGGMTVYFDDLTINGEKVDLSKDPGWEGVGNVAEFEDFVVRPVHRFGWSRETSHAGGRPGEAGGIVWRADERNDDGSAYYGAAVGPLSLDQELKASGRIVLLSAGSDSGVLIGWFNSKTPFGTPGPGTVAAFMEGPSRIGHYFRPAFSDAAGNRRIADGGPVIRPDGRVHEWTIHYDPRGRLTTTLDGRESVLDLPRDRAVPTTVDRFGIVTWKCGGHHVIFYLDDLTYTARPAAAGAR